jgi:putative RNA 2'-phosphotransferase
MEELPSSPENKGCKTAMPPDTKTSKFLSLVLRHKPDAIGLKLDASGWADIADLIAKARQAGVILTPAKITQIVATSDKRRFAISDDGNRIRANQGHSVPVDLGLPRTEPPEFLYHGTAQRSLTAIRTNGILPMMRTLVHLSQDRTTAIEVGRRHGTPVVLKIHAGQMHRDGFAFQRSENGVWLTKHVPMKYIEH